MNISQEDALKEIMNLTVTRYFLQEDKTVVLNSITNETRPMTFEERMDYILYDIEIHINSSPISEEALSLFTRMTPSGKEKLLKMAFRLR